MRVVRALVAPLLFIAIPLFAQSSGSVKGVVTTNTHAPASRTTVEITDLHRSTTTDSEGKYTFENVPLGRHLLLATSTRYGVASSQVVVNGPTTVNLELDLAVHSEAIVVSASMDPREASDVAQPVESVSGQELDAREQPTLGETLAQEPGVSSTGFVPGASRPVIRGFGGDRIRILEDGVGTGDASNVSQDHNVTIDPRNAESIEIVRGPATLLYGSNAVGGIVNVIDERIPMEKTDQPISGSVDLLGSSNASERNGHLSLFGGNGPFAWQGAFTKRQTDDYDTPIGKLLNSDIDANSESAGGSYVGEHGFVGVAYGRYDTNYGVSDAGPGNVPEETVRIDMRQRRWDLKSEWAPESGPFSRWKLRYGNTDYRHAEVVDGEPEAIFFNKSNEVRLEATHRDLGPLHGAIGVQYSDRDFRVGGEESLLPPTDTKSRAVFAFEETGQNAWRFQFGARYENQDVGVDSPDLPDRSFDGLSGSVGAVWSPNDDYTAALSLSHSARLPVAEELYFDGAHEATFQFEIGNPNLRKETGTGIDLSLRKRTGVVTGSLSFFRQSFDGYIFQSPTGDEEDGFPVYEFAQQDATFRGAEAHADIELVHRDPHHLAIEVTSDFVRATLDRGGSLPFIPPFRYGVGLRYQGAALFALAEFRHANAQDNVAEFETTTPGYTLVNAAIGYRIFTGDLVHDLMLRGNNLTDELAYNHVNPLKDSVPLTGRDITLSYRITF